MKFIWIVVLAVVITVINLALDAAEQSQRSDRDQSVTPTQQQRSELDELAASAKRLSDLLTKATDNGVAGAFAEAQQVLIDALAISPHDVSAKQGLKVAEDAIAGRVQRKAAIHLFESASYGWKGMWDKATAAARQAVALEPRYAEAYTFLAQTYAHQSMTDEVIAACEKAISISPDNALAHGNLALVYGKKGMLDLALDEAKKAAAIDPNLADAYATVGQVYVRKGMLHEAIAQLERAIAINPHRADSHAAIAGAYGSIGNDDQAIKAWWVCT